MKWQLMVRYDDDDCGASRISDHEFKWVAKFWAKVYNKIDNEDGCPKVVYFVPDEKAEGFKHAMSQ